MVVVFKKTYKLSHRIDKTGVEKKNGGGDPVIWVRGEAACLPIAKEFN